jgi:serine/threonine protein kinase
LCDFGFSDIRHEVTLTHTNIREGGRLCFLAPELSYEPDSFRTTAASDVYSLAMTLFNLSTLRTPFEEYRNELVAAYAARSGQRPQIPSTTRFFKGSFSGLRELLTLMWAPDESARPAAAMVAQRLQEVLHPFMDSNNQESTLST